MYMTHFDKMPCCQILSPQSQNKNVNWMHRKDVTTEGGPKQPWKQIKLTCPPRCKWPMMDLGEGGCFGKDPCSSNHQLSQQQTNKTNLSLERELRESRKAERAGAGGSLTGARGYLSTGGIGPLKTWWPITPQSPDRQVEAKGGHCVYSWGTVIFNTEVIDRHIPIYDRIFIYHELLASRRFRILSRS